MLFRLFCSRELTSIKTQKNPCHEADLIFFHPAATTTTTTILSNTGCPLGVPHRRRTRQAALRTTGRRWRGHWFAVLVLPVPSPGPIMMASGSPVQGAHSGQHGACRRLHLPHGTVNRVPCTDMGRPSIRLTDRRHRTGLLHRLCRRRPP